MLRGRRLFASDERVVRSHRDLRLHGCDGEHHVSLDLLHKMSTPDHDYASKGFLAADRTREMKAADLELMSLQKIEDVSATVNEAGEDRSAIPAGMHLGMVGEPAKTAAD